MTTEFDYISIVLANRCYLYQLLQRMTGNEPSLKLMEVVTSEHTSEALKLILDETDQRFKDYFALLASLKQALRTDTASTLSKLKDEYNRLFIAPNPLPAPPWESVYTSVEKALFQPSTLEVRRIYIQHHYLPANYPNEADDHLALELDFMYHMAQKTQSSFEERNQEEAIRLLFCQKEFLEQHLLNWIGSFATDIQKSKTQHFYPQTAVLAEQLLILDKQILSELIVTL